MTPAGRRQENRRERRAVLMGLAASLLALAVGIGFFYILRIAGVGVPAMTRVELQSLLAPHIEVFLPEGDGPFPAVVLMHGCGGRQPMYDRYAALAVEAGVAAIVPDSFAPRGISRAEALTYVCTGALLQGRERAGDLAVVLDWAKEHPLVDSANLAVAGWSHGGWTIMDLMTMDLARGRGPQGLSDPPDDALAGVNAAFLIYPYCAFPALSRDRLMLHPASIDAVIGSDDRVVGLADCASTFAREAEQGREVSWEIWAGLGHSFDDPDQPAMLAQLRYDEDAAARLEQAFSDFLQRRLAPTPLGRLSQEERTDEATGSRTAPGSPVPEAQ